MGGFRIDLAAVAVAILMIVGCGSSEDRPVEMPAAAETAPAEPLGNEAPGGDQWTTVATLRSSDPAWQDMPGILVSEPFTATGEVQVVLNMPDAAATDGVVGVIIPADRANDVRELLAAIRDGVAVTMIGAAPVQVFSDLDGHYVFVNSVPAPKAWSLDLQTQP